MTGDLRAARAVGATWSLFTLAIALSIATGVAKMADGQVARGLWMVAAAVALRGVGALGLEQWTRRSAARARSRARGSLVDVLSARRRRISGAASDLAVATEDIGDEASLERLKSSAGVGLVGVVAVAVSAGWLATVIVVALLAVSVPLYQRAGRRSEASEAVYDARRAALEDRQLAVLRHIDELRGVGAVGYGADQIAAYSRREHEAAIAAVRVALGSSAVTEFISGVSVGLVSMVVGFALLRGAIDLPRALIAVFATTEVFTHVRRFGAEFHRRQDATRARELLSTPARVPVAPHDAVLAVSQCQSATGETISFSVQRGERVVVAGPSGVGKTTVLESAVGWRQPATGTASIDARRVGVVSSDTPLLDASIRENLDLGLGLDDLAMRSVLDELGLEAASGFDLGRDVGVDGRGVSDGERVRLAVARALVHEVDLLILDDVAATLDPLSRDRVRHALERRGGLTVVEACVDQPLLRGAREVRVR